MNNTTLQIKFKTRLNKLASEDFDNIQCWEIVEAFNKAQLEWCRRQLRGSNPFKDGDEMSKRRVDDLQILLTTLGLTGDDVWYSDEFGYFLSDNFDTVYDPNTGDYLEFKKIETYATQSLPGICGEPGVPGTPDIPGTDPTDPIYGDRPWIPGEPAVYPVWEDGGDEVYNGHSNQDCCVGFQVDGNYPKCTSDWQNYGPVLGDGSMTIEEFWERCPIETCCWTKTVNCDSTENPNCAEGDCWPTDENGAATPAFCECIATKIQASETWSCDDASWVDVAENLRQFDWDGNQFGPLACNDMVPPEYELCEEGSDGGWYCEVGEYAGQEVPNGEFECIPEIPGEWGDRPIIVPGEPGTDPIEGTDPIPGTPDGPPRPHPNSGDHCCGPDHKRSMTTYLSEVANVDVILRDPLKNPNFDWAETICTLQDKQIRIWRSDFYVIEPKLIYYRKPVNIEIVGCINPMTNVESFQEIECEFKDDIVELIIDEAVSIVAGDILDVNQFARGTQSSEKNN